jgi:hypothetical protein
MSIEVVPCSEHNCVDLRDSRFPDREEVLHLGAAEWAEFLSAVKAGVFDHVSGRQRAIQGPPDAELRGLLPSDRPGSRGGSPSGIASAKRSKTANSRAMPAVTWTLGSWTLGSSGPSVNASCFPPGKLGLPLSRAPP